MALNEEQPGGCGFKRLNTSILIRLLRPDQENGWPFIFPDVTFIPDFPETREPKAGLNRLIQQMQHSAQQVVDEILVMDAQDGREEALEALVGRWQKRLWWHACNLTGSADDAWEITQESWLAIVRGLSRLNDPARFGSWAYRIVTNKAHDRLRRRGRDACPAPAPDPQETETVSPPDPVAGEVREILRRLPAAARTVLHLRYLEGFDLAELAEILGIPEGTVKSRLHSARAEFRKLWERPDPMPMTAT